MEALLGLLFVGLLGAGAVCVVIVASLFSRVGALSSRVGQVERQLARLSQATAPVERHSAPQPAETVSAPQRRQPDSQPFDLQNVPPPGIRRPEPPRTPLHTPAPPEAAVVAAVVEEQAKARGGSRRPEIDWEMFAGGRFFNIVGAIVLIIGVGLFMKYAFDSDWINAPLRVALGLLAGIAAIAIGAFTHEKQKKLGRAWFPEGVFGAGLGILYVSGFTSFQSYHLVSFVLAFTFMSVVTAVAFSLALRYQSIAMALIGYAGGFVTPFALGIGNTDQGGLAAYILLLDAGLAAVALARRQWFALRPLALGASYIVAVTWYVLHSANASSTVSAIASVGLWAIFFASGVVAAFRETGNESPASNVTRTVVDIVNAIALWFSLDYLIGNDRTQFALVQLCVAIAYACAYANVLRKSPLRRQLRTEHLSGAAAFVTGTVFAYVGHGELAPVFAALAIASAIVANRRRDPQSLGAREASFCALGFYVVSLLSLLALPDRALPILSPWTLGIGGRDCALISFAAAGFIVDRLLRRSLPVDATGVLLRQASLVTIFAIEALHLRGFDLSIAVVSTGLAISLINAALRKGGSAYAPAFEVISASFVMLGLGAISFMLSPESLSPAIGALDLQLCSRDVALAFVALVAFVLDRMWRSDSETSDLSIGFRFASLAAVVSLEWLHAHDLAFVTVVSLTSILFLTFDRALRAIGNSYASKREVGLTALGLLTISWAGVVVAINQLIYSGPGLFAGFGKIDSTLAALAIATIAFLRLSGRNLPPMLSAIARQSIVLVLLIAALRHTTSLGLATCIAIATATPLGVARLMRAIGAPEMSQREERYSAISVFSLAWFVLLGAQDTFSYTSGGIFLRFGEIDSTLAALVTSAYFLLRAYAASIPAAGRLVLRQTIVAALLIGGVKHATGLELWATLSVEAFVFAIVGTTRMLRDVEIDGVAFLASSLFGMVVEPAAWQARDLGAFVPFHDERAVALSIIGIVAILAGECYRRRSLLPVWIGRGARLAGTATIVFECTGELRDWFERAILEAGPNAVLAIAQLRDRESLAVSALWIVASVIVIALGIALKLKDFRIAAIALFDLTILKAFFVDLGSLAPIYRIFSFVGLGITLLAVSYFYQRLEGGTKPPESPLAGAAPDGSDREMPATA